MGGRLAGKVALITGTAGGQDRVAAQAFVAQGAVVVGTDIQAEDAAETVGLVELVGSRMDSTASVRPRRRAGGEVLGGRRRRAARWDRHRLQQSRFHPVLTDRRRPRGRTGRSASATSWTSFSWSPGTPGRIWSPEEVVNCVLFLASDEARTRPGRPRRGPWLVRFPTRCRLTVSSFERTCDV